MHNRGFTLLETIIYIALFSIIMGGTLVAVFQLFSSGSLINNKNVAQDEANFVMRKIEWALGSIDPTKVFTPSSGYSNTLSLTQYNGAQIRMRINTGKIEMSEDGGVTYLPITTNNVTVSSLQFEYLPAVGNGPAGIIASTSISGLLASTTKYIRK